MATDLFSKYYNNPSKSYIYTNLTCNGASGDEMSFDITGGNGVISDNENALSSIDLSSVHVPLTEYTNDMRVLDAHEIMYVKGITKGPSYMSKTYRFPCHRKIESEGWQYRDAITFALKYTDGKGLREISFVKAVGSEIAGKTFIEACQEIMDAHGIPLDVSCDKCGLTFTSAELGYEFWISHIVLWEKAVDPETGEYVSDKTLDEIIDEYVKAAADRSGFAFGFDNDFVDFLRRHGQGEDSIVDSLNVYSSLIPQREYQQVYHMLDVINCLLIDLSNDERAAVNVYFLFEDFMKYVPAFKYKNGAMKGCLVVPVYPVYNAENIKTYQKSLKIVHIQDRVEDYETTLQNDFYNMPLYVKILRDVVDSFSAQAEYDRYLSWSKSGSEWVDPDRIPHPVRNDRHGHDGGDGAEWTGDEVPDNFEMLSVYRDGLLKEYIGLYGFCNYATEHRLWMTVGNAYLRTAVDDDESTYSRNLIPSFIIYNPNDFPVTVKYMTFI